MLKRANEKAVFHFLEVLGPFFSGARTTHHVRRSSRVSVCSANGPSQMSLRSCCELLKALFGIILCCGVMRVVIDLVFIFINVQHSDNLKIK